MAYGVRRNFLKKSKNELKAENLVKIKVTH